MSTPPSFHPRLLGAIVEAIEQGRPDQAAAAAHDLRGRYPAEPEPARLHAIALLQAGRVDAARAALLQARQLAPRSIEILCNLGSVLLAGGDAAGAVAALQEAEQLAPAHPAVLAGLGNARRAGGDLAGARQAYARATAAAPGYLPAWLNCAGIELALGAAPAAERLARHALALAPGHPEGLLLLGHALAAQGRHADAAAAYAQGARAAPADARFPYQQGLMAEELRQLPQAAAAHARALALDPGADHALGQLVFLRRQLCDWRDLEALSARLRARVAAGGEGIAPFAFLAEPASAEEQLQCARTFATAIEAKAAPLRTRLQHAAPPVDAAAPVRVGFVSNGFGSHPTGLLTVALFEALRRDRQVDAHLFSTATDDGSAIARRLQAAATWHPADGLGPAALAQHIQGERIEVLVDLRGYGGGSSAEALALRPAPVQVGWLAYPGTSGAPWLDYAIADAVVLPDWLRPAFSETVLWLPRCFQPSDPTREVGEPPPREACGLPPHGMVYACFNNRYKINPATFTRMLAVLRGVPDSVLWLLAGPDGSDERLRAEAAQCGLDPARLVFMPKLPHADYLARFRHAGVFLDSSPYGAHTTASDATWAGCPVLTVPGRTFASRVAASINHHLGLEELNLADDDALVASAVRLGRDPAELAALRTRLAARRVDSGLFDMAAFARDFASLLQHVAQRHRAGLPPAAPASA